LDLFAQAFADGRWDMILQKIVFEFLRGVFLGRFELCVSSVIADQIDMQELQLADGFDILRQLFRVFLRIINAVQQNILNKDLALGFLE